MQNAKTVGAVIHTLLLIDKKQSMKNALLNIQKNDNYARDG